MLLQTNSYVVPKERRAEHARLVRRFRQALLRLGCDQFEVYEQVGTNWTSDQSSGRFVQIMRFRDRKHQLAVQAAEKNDGAAQTIIAEFCELINFPYQQQQGLFAIGYYTAVLGSGKLLASPESADEASPAAAVAVASAGAVPTPVTSEPITMVKEVSELVPVEDQSSSGEESTAGHVRNPFADAPIVAPADDVAAPSGEERAEAVETPVTESNGEHVYPVGEGVGGGGGNGNGHFHSAPIEEVGADELQPAVLDAEPSPASAAVELDELIKQHFGEGLRTDEGRNGNHRELVGGGSGIGAVLDAGLGDDPDLDIALPAELLDQPETTGSHHSDPHRRHDDANDA